MIAALAARSRPCHGAPALSAAPFSAVYFDGRFMPAGEARIPIADRGYLLGEGVFETLRGYDGVCFRPEHHFETLTRGARAFGLTVPISIVRLTAIADEAASRTKARDAYVRVTLTRGADAAEGAKGVLSVLARPLEVPRAEDYARGVPATIVSARRFPPACMDPTVKTTSYAPQVLARREAVARGVGEGEGIMLAVDGTLACGTMANVFVVDGNVLRTPHLASGCRSGVTRGAVLDVAARAGLSVREEAIDPAQLFEADEAFFSSTRVECLPIASVDGRAIGRPVPEAAARYPRTTALRAALRALVVGECARETASERRGIA